MQYLLTVLFPPGFFSADVCLLSTIGSCVGDGSLPSTVARPSGAIGGDTGETGSSDKSRGGLTSAASKSCDSSTSKSVPSPMRVGIGRVGPCPNAAGAAMVGMRRDCSTSESVTDTRLIDVFFVIFF